MKVPPGKDTCHFCSCIVRLSESHGLTYLKNKQTSKQTNARLQLYHVLRGGKVEILGKESQGLPAAGRKKRGGQKRGGTGFGVMVGGRRRGSLVLNTGKGTEPCREGRRGRDRQRRPAEVPKSEGVLESGHERIATGASQRCAPGPFGGRDLMGRTESVCKTGRLKSM